MEMEIIIIFLTGVHFKAIFHDVNSVEDLQLSQEYKRTKVIHAF